MMGRLLTPEAAPGELFAGYAATLKSEQLPSGLRGFVRRWRHSDLQVWQADKLGISPPRSQRASPSGDRVEKLQSFSVARTCVVLRRRRAIAAPSGYKVPAPETNELCSPNPCIGWRRCRTERSPRLREFRLVGERFHDLRHSAGRRPLFCPFLADTPPVSIRRCLNLFISQSSRGRRRNSR
jgi:hypothetical protein